MSTSPLNSREMIGLASTASPTELGKATIIVKRIACPIRSLARPYSSRTISLVSTGTMDEHIALASAIGTLTSTLYLPVYTPQISVLTSLIPFATMTLPKIEVSITSLILYTVLLKSTGMIVSMISLKICG